MSLGSSIPQSLISCCHIHHRILRTELHLSIAVSFENRKAKKMELSEISSYDLIIGIDAGKYSHEVCVLERPTGEIILSETIESEEKSIRSLFSKVSSCKKVLVVTDQSRTFGSILVRVAKDMKLDVALISSKGFSYVAKVWKEDKTDKIDASILCNTAVGFPHLLRLIKDQDEILEQLRVLLSMRQDFVAERTRAYNRLHDLLCQICPTWETLLSGSKLHTVQALTILSKYGSPKQLRRAGIKAISWIKNQNGCGASAQRLIEKMLFAAREIKANIAAEEYLEQHIKRIARRIVELEKDCVEITEEIDTCAMGLQNYALIRTIPGFGVYTSALAVTYIEDISRFKSAAHLASFAGLAPVIRKSGTSVNRVRARKSFCRYLKEAFYKSTQVCIRHDEESKKFYDKKIAEGKKHNQAIKALARRRINVVFAILKADTPFISNIKAA